MKLIAGQTLAQAMKTADRPRLLQAFAQVCQAVGLANSRALTKLSPEQLTAGTQLWEDVAALALVLTLHLLR